MKQVKIIIPARYNSTRFIGKPLVDINGKPMIIRVVEIACETLGKEMREFQMLLRIMDTNIL